MGYMHAMGEVVAQSLLRTDTDHHVFCGCIDWHSSVHGCYALLVASRLTGETGWEEVVRAILDPDLLQKELDDVRHGKLDHELPYGYAWFLKLTKEYEQNIKQEILSPLASEIAGRLEKWLGSLSPEEIQVRLRDRKYGNLSWPILNLWEWSQWKGDLPLSEKLIRLTEQYLIPSHREKTLEVDVHEDEFFSSSLQQIRVILAVFPQSVSQSWFVTCARHEEKVQPLTQAPFPHSGGLNFSRTWGLWDLFGATQKKAFRDLYVQHIVTHLELPQFWRDDYKKFGHWVPQFGIYALALSMDAPEGAFQ